MLDRFLGRRPEQHKPRHRYTLDAENNVTIIINSGSLPGIEAPIDAHMPNLRSAKEKGIVPLTFRDIITSEKLKDTKVGLMVLFDNPFNFGAGLSNHWRVANNDVENEQVTLEFCNPLGSGEFPIEPFTIGYDVPFFTGVSVVDYPDISLSQMALAVSGGMVDVPVSKAIRDEVYVSAGASRFLDTSVFQFIEPQER